MDPKRRRILGAIAASAAIAPAGCHRQPDRGLFVDDIGSLERTPVAGIVRPDSTAGVLHHLGGSPAIISIGGGRYSMGGQTAADGSLHLDMRGMHRLLWLDPGIPAARVQAGMRWRDLQDILDPHDLAVKIMQSYSNFTVGGSVSVNCHGRYVGTGPIVNSIRALQLVTADGAVHELSRDSRPELFAAVVGGYGGLGVITEVELDLAANCTMARSAERVALADYPAYFQERILRDPDMVLHNADLVPPDFDRPLAISWAHSDAALTEQRRLVPRNLDYGRERGLIWAASELPNGERLRERHMTERLLREHPVQRRNYEASLDVASLEPRTRAFSTYLLQEYFVPVAGFASFARDMTTILRSHRVNALNVSIRHSPADTITLLRWAATEVFCFVLYYKQRNSPEADRAAGAWSRELIAAALAHGGRHYLPYRLHASRAQFLRGYPRAAEFARIRDRVDPGRRFRNRLWDRYLTGPGNGPG
ncbi:FAD-binding oxidoreductase [Luteimonas sp. SJ-92]|uniref:FAD-binding oxidoreductase n=1 Tax=Luteimonas salinisoli TaxID=2752307 RepID=A0A853JCA5_9GAMM|nr:FAD-binding oxidoreductase [Luteimonas salinisoli]NZA26384.1 FAD-binding oxidoreductase [Luteimonas salinisoli]